MPPARWPSCLRPARQEATHESSTPETDPARPARRTRLFKQPATRPTHWRTRWPGRTAQSAARSARRLQILECRPTVHFQGAARKRQRHLWRPGRHGSGLPAQGWPEGVIAAAPAIIETLAAGTQNPSSTILPRALPLSSRAWARFRLLALMAPKCSPTVVRIRPASTIAASSSSKRP